MKTKILKKLKAGFFVVLPVVLFVWILSWIFGVVSHLVNGFLDLFPSVILITYSLYFLQIASILLFVLFILFIGYLFTHYYVGDKIKKLFKLFSTKIPLFSMLFRISEQLGDSLDKNESFKKVVLVKFPNKWTYSIGFITSEDLDIFNEATGKVLVSIFIPTTPNPTNGFLVLIEKRFVKEINCPVSLAISFIVSMGTYGATKKILESYLKQR